MLGRLPLVTDHTELGFNLRLHGQQKEMEGGCIWWSSPKDAYLAVRLTALSSGLWRMIPAPRSDRLLFHFASDKWQRGLLPVACLSLSFILSFFLVTLSSLPSQTWIERLIFCLDNLLISLSHIRCAFWVFCVVWMDVGSEKSVCGRHVIWCKAFYPSSSHLKTISCSGKTFFDITFSLSFRPAVFMVALAVLWWGKLLPSTQEHEGSLRRPPCPAPAHLPHLSPHLRPRWMRPFPGPSPPPWQLTAPLLPPQPHWELPPWESPSLFPAELHPLWVHGDAGVHVSHRPLHL